MLQPAFCVVIAAVPQAGQLARSRYQVTARTHVRNGRSVGLSKSRALDLLAYLEGKVNKSHKVLA